MADSIENILPEEGAGSHHGRRRYKYRYKRKRSKKRRIKKYLEYVLWITIIAVFIISLFILIRQMDITDESVKKKRKKSEITVPVNSLPVCKLASGYLISHYNFI